jgi:hypothetical protein
MVPGSAHTASHEETNHHERALDTNRSVEQATFIYMDSRTSPREPIRGGSLNLPQPGDPPTNMIAQRPVSFFDLCAESHAHEITQRDIALAHLMREAQAAAAVSTQQRHEGALS